MTLEDLIQSFGAPSEARGYVRVDGIRTIQCRYKSNAFTDDVHPRVVDLNFTEVNGQFELDTKIFIGLGREQFAQASEDSYQYNWTQTDIDSLVLGASPSGLGGSDYSVLVARFGLPKTIETSGSNDHYSLVASYPDATSHKTLVLRFARQAEGNYLLYDKTTDD